MNAISAASYRSCSNLTHTFTDQSTGVTFTKEYDYSTKEGLAFSAIMARKDAPDWVFNRNFLWQRIEEIEARVNSELAKEMVIALPVELTVEQNIELLKEFVMSSLVSCGMVVDVNFHNDNPENPHAHIMFPMRSLGEVIRENGEIELDFSSKVREWKSKTLLKAIRHEQALIINHYLERYGFADRVSELSHRERGLDIIPGVHEGPARWMKGAELREYNQQIARENASRIIMDPTIVIDKLSIDKPVFTSCDIERSLAKVLAVNMQYDSSVGSSIEHSSLKAFYSESDLVSLYQTVIASEKITLVNPYDLEGRMVFARTDRMELEERFDKYLCEIGSNNSHVLGVSKSDIGKLSSQINFSDQQKEAIVSLVNSGNLAVLEGLPGAGKSTVMKEVVRLYKEAGYEVIGVAPTNKAAEALAQKIDVDVKNCTKLRQIWQQAKGYEEFKLGLSFDYYKEKQYSDFEKNILSDKTLLIMDEASMIDLPTMDYYVSNLLKAGGKIIMLGDNNQNPAIGSKGGFARAGDVVGIGRVYLSEINRHRNCDESVRLLHIQATKALGRFDVARAIKIYDELGMIRIFETEEEKRAAIVRDFTVKVIELSSQSRHIDYSDEIAMRRVGLVAYTNEEVSCLNAMVRDSLKKAGIIRGEGFNFISGNKHSGNVIELCEGDQIIFKSNKAEFNGYGGVINNEIGIVSRIIKVNNLGVGEFEVKVRDGGGQASGYRLVRIITGEGEHPIKFNHGYAFTSHVFQGADVSLQHFSIDKFTGYESFNVGATRHIDDCKFYASREVLEDEVYKAKGLDLEKIREEFTGFAYEYSGGEVIAHGRGGKASRVEVPLWMVGLRLLISRRTNLNLAKNYRYENNIQDFTDSKEVEKLKGNIALYREKLNDANKKLEHWALEASEPVLNCNNLVASDYGLRFDLEKLTSFRKYGRLELLVRRDFYIREDFPQVIVNPEAIIKSARDFLGIEGCISSDNAKTISDYVNSLHLRDWALLTGRDQDLVLRSYIEEGERKELEEYVRLVSEYENKIKHLSSCFELLMHEVVGQSKEFVKRSGGNLGLMRDYKNERERVRRIYQKISKIDKKLRSREVIESLREKYNIVLNDGDMKDITTHKIMTANSSFAGDHNSRRFTIGLMKHILETTKDNNLKKLYEDINLAANELKEAISYRKEKAALIVENYGRGYVANCAIGEMRGLSIADFISQLGWNYETISRHANLSQVKYYFEERDEIRDRTIINDHRFGNIMEVLLKASNANAESIVRDEDILSLCNSCSGLMDDIRGSISRMQELRADLKEVGREKFVLKNSIESHEKFTMSELPHYLSKIYSNKPSEIIKKIDEIKESELCQLLASISKKPELLGSLRKEGLFDILLYRESVRQRKTNLSRLEGIIKEYVASKEEAFIAKEKLNSGELEARERGLEAEIGILNKQQPCMGEESILRQIEIIAGSVVRNRVANDDYRSQVAVDNKRIKSAKYELIKLARSDAAIDILLSYEEAKARNINKDQREEKAKTIERENEDGNKSRTNAIAKDAKFNVILDFAEVKQRLNPLDIEKIFRNYAPMINQDGEIVKSGNSIRSGSLNMNLDNGQWYRFSNGAKGDIFSFIMEANGCSSKDALEEVARVVGVEQRIGTMKGTSRDWNMLRSVEAEEITARRVSNNQVSEFSGWVPYEVVPRDACIFDVKRDLSWFLDGGEVEHIWHYKNERGEDLGKVVRVSDGSIGGKRVIPVSYCHNEALGEDAWRAKGFLDNGHKPIYGAEKLCQDLKPVLVVEGERTADKAKELFQDYSVISWMGGSNAADRVNWEVVLGREVVIWPDNDGAGLEAAEVVVSAINKANGFSGFCKIVDVRSLSLPEKWDLADEIPDHLTVDKIRNEVTKLTKNHDKDIDVLYHENLVSNLSEEDQRIYWQNRVASRDIIDTKIYGYNFVKDRINDQELIIYENYNLEKEGARSVDDHEFLKLSSGLYREMLNHSMLSRIAKGKISKSMLEKFDKGEDGDHKLSVKEVIEITCENHKKELHDFRLGEVLSNDAVRNDQEFLKRTFHGDNIREFLHFTLTRDLALMHSQILGVKRLSEPHLSKLSESIKDVIDSYSRSHKDKAGNYRSFDDSDKIKIAEEVGKTVNSVQWWKEVAIKEMTHAHVKRMEFEEEVRSTINSCRFEIDDIRKLKPNYDISSLERDLRVIHPDKREQHINAILFNEIACKVTSEFESIDQSKAKSKTSEDFIRTIDAEKELCNKVLEEYPSLNLSNQIGSMNPIDNKIAETMLFHDERMYFIEELRSHINVIEKENIWPKNKLLQFLKNENNYNIAEAKLNNICKDHLVSNVIDDIHRIESHGFADRAGRRFESTREYLEYRLSNKEHSHYLRDSVAHDLLHALHSGRAVDLERAGHVHTQQMQTAKLEIHTKTHEMEIHKDYGKSC